MNVVSCVGVGKGGTLVASLIVLLLVGLFVWEKYSTQEPWDASTDMTTILGFIITGITLLVVAVPEGMQ